MKDVLGADAEPFSYGAVETKIWNAPFGEARIVPVRFEASKLPDGAAWRTRGWNEKGERNHE